MGAGSSLRVPRHGSGKYIAQKEHAELLENVEKMKAAPPSPASSSSAAASSSPTHVSVGQIKQRLRDLGCEIPAGALEKSELVTILEEAELKAAAAGPSVHASTAPLTPLTPSAPSSSAWPGSPSSSLSVAKLKGRLKELGLEAPSNLIEKSELIGLVEEAERQAAKEKVPPCERKSPRPQESVPVRDGRSVAELKARLRELGAEVPSSVVMKTELLALVLEKEGKKKPRRSDYMKEAFRDQAGAGAGGEGGDRSSGGPGGGGGGVACAEEAAAAAAATPGGGGDGRPRTSGTAPNAVKGSKFTWVRGETLGRGSLGTVFKGLDQHTGRVIAVKEVFLSDSDNDCKFRESLEQEITIMKDLEHRHIVHYLGHDYMDHCLFMYLEYMSGGSIAYILREFGPFDEEAIVDYGGQLLSGLEYLHTTEPAVVHRDIKGANVLVGLDGRAALADFGCSKRVQETMTHTMMRGSIPWMAPEVVAHTRYGRPADVWSFGCLVIEMGTARVPWGSFDNQMAALIKIGMSKETPPLPEGISETCKDFIARCVQRDHAKRPSASELRGHALVRDFVPFV